MSEGEPAPQKRKRTIEEKVKSREQRKEKSTKRYKAKLILKEKLGCEKHDEVKDKLEDVMGNYLAKDWEHISKRLIKQMVKDGYDEDAIRVLVTDDMYPQATIRSNDD